MKDEDPTSVDLADVKKHSAISDAAISKEIKRITPIASTVSIDAKRTALEVPEHEREDRIVFH